jgi:hypothetical protein
MARSEPPPFHDLVDTARLDLALRWCLEHRHVDRLLLAVRNFETMDGSTFLNVAARDSTRRLFASHVIRETAALSWPGVEVYEPAHVFLIEFSEEVRELMVTLSVSLTGWDHQHDPPLAADPCLYRRGDAWPTLISVSRLNEGWILHDGLIDRTIARPARIALPLDLIPAPPEFVREPRADAD